MKPITFFASTPAINAMAAEYGDYFQKLSVGDRLAICAALTEGLLHAEAYEQNYELWPTLACSGHEFFGGYTGQNVDQLQGFIEALDAEIDLREAAQLATGILQTIYS